jgi:LysM repeat protein
MWGWIRKEIKMKIKLIHHLLIFLTIIVSLSSTDSIQAQGDNANSVINRYYRIWGQRDLVVQPTDTPTSPDPTTVPIIVSTPRDDGTVLHIIASGQSLWAISEAYDVPFEDLLELNELDPDTIVLPGDEVIISPSFTPTRTPIGEPSSTPPPRYTHTPSQGIPESTEVTFAPATSPPTETIQADPRFRDSVKNPLVVITAVVIAGGSLAAALYFGLRKS